VSVREANMTELGRSVADSVTLGARLRSKNTVGGSLAVSLAVHGLILLVLGLVTCIVGLPSPMVIIHSRINGPAESSLLSPEMLFPEKQPELSASSMELTDTLLPKVALPVPAELLANRLELASQTAGDGGQGTGGTASGVFFGVPLTENSIVFVLDRSGSMQGGRIQRVHYELQSAINGLAPDQFFNVLLYNSEVVYALPVSHTGLLPASDMNRKKVLAAARACPATGGTNGVLAIQQALQLRSEAIVFLTDGEFEIHVENDVIQKNSQRTMIHTVSIGDGASLEVLRRIARSSSGKFQHVSVENVQRPHRPVISPVDRRAADRLLRLAKGLERRRKFDRARDCCRKILKEYPQLPEVTQAEEMLQRIGTAGTGPLPLRPDAS